MTKLTKQEKEFLLTLIEEHRSYYKKLAGHPSCTPVNKARYSFIEALCQKLESKPK